LREPLGALSADGTVVEDDVTILAKLAATMVDFDPRFEILPGTKLQSGDLVKADAYEAVPGKCIAE
jgi:hypothetical protein